jgi:hypothetical protein
MKAKNSKSKLLETQPLMVATAAETSTRRNKAATIERTDKYKNIDDGLIPFRYTRTNYADRSTIDIKDATILCQKAYYNFAQFRNVIDLMTEFSVSNLYFQGGTKKARDFFEALFNKINLWSFQDRFFREYYRSGNVFVYRFDGELTQEDTNRLISIVGRGPLNLDNVKIPVRYIIVNPVDIQFSAGTSYLTGKYYKVLSEYELSKLRVITTEEDQQIFDSLDEQTQKLVQNSKIGSLRIQLNPERFKAVFYKKQDYEPFSVPMGYPVLEDINFKAELKKMDMAIARTMQQAILLVTMGTEPEKGGINQRNLESMQKLFENESVGRVLIADYTTKAEFVIPQISELLDPKKYETVNNDINMGLNNILVGGEKFSNQEAKIDVFLARLNQGRQAFINDFLLPEIKRISKALGFRGYPVPYFEEVNLKDNTVQNRVYTRLLELGVLTPEETIKAIETGVLPDQEASLESQRTAKDLRDQGYYNPIIGGSKSAEQSAGRPVGTTAIPKQIKAQEEYSFLKVKDNFIKFQELQGSVENHLKKKHNKKKLTDAQKQIAEEISKIIIANEEIEKWKENVENYCNNPIDRNPDRINQINEIAAKHGVDPLMASILFNSKK